MYHILTQRASEAHVSLVGGALGGPEWGVRKSKVGLEPLESLVGSSHISSTILHRIESDRLQFTSVVLAPAVSLPRAVPLGSRLGSGPPGRVNGFILSDFRDRSRSQ